MSDTKEFFRRTAFLDTVDCEALGNATWKLINDLRMALAASEAELRIKSEALDEARAEVEQLRAELARARRFSGSIEIQRYSYDHLPGKAQP